jgi:hypothetical protein
MKAFYIAIIALSALFNSMTQCYAYDAWKTGIPLERIIQAGGSVDDAMMLMSMHELGEIRTV